MSSTIDKSTQLKTGPVGKDRHTYLFDLLRQVSYNKQEINMKYNRGYSGG